VEIWTGYTAYCNGHRVSSSLSLYVTPFIPMYRYSLSKRPSCCCVPMYIHYTASHVVCVTVLDVPWSNEGIEQGEATQRNDRQLISQH
jgi:hypothetical protein